jgi:threonine dehydratase
VRTFIERLDDMLMVSEEELREAMRLLLRTAHVVAEESGAAATAGAAQVAERLQGKKVVILVTGGNVPLERLREVVGGSELGVRN